jgi:alkanesulfonate monooxygenase SsuD/methylene tetrahydromethanopterin reductase-like flavin-dependent oxidoreductase (luciferase family)
MNVGLILGMEYPAGDDPVRRCAEHREQGRLARAAGFDLIGIPHHYSRGPSQWLPPLLSAAALAADAGDMRIATTVFLLPMHHPVETAEQAAMLDVITGGRFVFGVGAGWQPSEFRALGVPMEGRLARLEEALAIIERLWSGEAITFHGRHFTLDDVRLTLRPVQRPRPPIWMGANAAAAAVRRADALAWEARVAKGPEALELESRKRAERQLADAACRHALVSDDQSVTARVLLGEIDLRFASRDRVRRLVDEALKVFREAAAALQHFFAGRFGQLSGGVYLGPPFCSNRSRWSAGLMPVSHCRRSARMR